MENNSWQAFHKAPLITSKLGQYFLDFKYYKKKDGWLKET